MNDTYSIPADALLALIAHLRSPMPGPHPDSAEFRRYLAGVEQGYEQAAKRIEELLAEYGVLVDIASSGDGGPQ